MIINSLPIVINKSLILYSNANAQYMNDKISDNVEYNSEFDSDTDEENENVELSFINKLRIWAVQNQITHVAINELLELLLTLGLKNLPKNSRTLLHTPRSVQIRSMGSGEYWHNGIEKCLKNTLCDVSESINLSLNFNIDGLPISGSSKFQFWPILMSIASKPHISPLVVAVYYGDSKPPTAELFLREFVNELNTLIQNGIEINKHCIKININAFICDSPARCFLKCNSFLHN